MELFSIHLLVLWVDTLRAVMPPAGLKPLTLARVDDMMHLVEPHRTTERFCRLEVRVIAPSLAGLDAVCSLLSVDVSLQSK